MCVLRTAEAEISCVGTEFLVGLYGGRSRSDLNSVRYVLFSKKVNSLQIKSRPPADQSAVNHIKQVHLQTILWCSADSVAPSDIDIDNFGWQITENKTVKPRYGLCKVASSSLLEVICCSCKSDNPCSKKLWFRLSELSCASYCKCGRGNAVIRQVQLTSLWMKMWMKLTMKLRTIIIRKQKFDMMKIIPIMIHVYFIVKIMQTLYCRTRKN